MLTWSDEFNTGIADIDRDHRQLADTLNRLETALNQGLGSRHVLEIITFLDAYAQQHFAREEGCMACGLCRKAEQNKAEHAVFLRKLEQARERVEGSPVAGAYVALQLHRDLCDWFVNHILRVDSELKTLAHPVVPAGEHETAN
jgi:hemerythrin